MSNLISTQSSHFVACLGVGLKGVEKKASPNKSVAAKAASRAKQLRHG
jgi:hypothetical protein